MTIQKYKESKLDNLLWPYNLSLDVGEDSHFARLRFRETYKIMAEWLKESYGHGDVFQRDGAWLSQKTEDPVNVEIKYFFWGPGCIQFKYEEDMIAFVLRFCG